MDAMIRKIQEGFERERELNREPVSALDLPLSFEAITDRWLTATLCRKVPEAAVVAHRLSGLDSGSSNRCKIHVEYNDRGEAAGLPKKLFCKATHALANRIILGISGGARSEALFYNTVRPMLDIEAPRGYFAVNDAESFNSFIMLGDLSSEVLTFCDHNTAMSRERVESQLRLLAKLHGSCYGNATLKSQIAPFPTFSEFFNNTLIFGMQEGSTAGFLAAEDVIPNRLYERSEEVWGATVAAIKTLDELPHTLAHGDVHLKNWYVATNGEMGLSDWQCAARAHWGRDFAYTIATALTIENRRVWEKELLLYYLEQLALAGGPRVDFATAWSIYRQQLISSLTWWTITLSPAPDMPDMQPRDVTLEFIRRIATAMDDLDSLDLRG